MSDTSLPASPTPSGAEKRFCIVGLGNPGLRYRDTPHNIGFLVLDELARRYSVPVVKREHAALTGSGRIRNHETILVKPQTFMNLSGTAAASILRYCGLTSENLIVIYDELDLPWGSLRIRTSGSAAGHNGVKSLIAALKTDVFTRVRVGIRPDHSVEDAAVYVLAPFERALRKQVDEAVSYTADAVESIVAEGAEKAMAKFNRRAPGIQSGPEPPK
jgi:PTH1 family peptidyl-tRNA hydrolase